MQYPESKEQSSEILRLALPRIATHGSGCEPTSYAVWYEYTKGANPALKQALDARMAAGGPLSAEETRDFYSRFIAARDDARAAQLHESLQRALAGLGSAVASAGHDASQFGHTLEGVGSRLNDPQDVDTLREVITTLAEETRRIQASNAQLGERLSATEQEFKQTKAELDAMRSEAQQDPLTGLKNRRGFQQSVDALLATRPQGWENCAVLMADLDHFKKINDTHGHLLGDRVLQSLGKILRDNTKGRDVAARFGGEEFVVLMPDTPAQGAMALAEQIRQVVARVRIRHRNDPEPIGGITLSLGVASYRAGETLEQWVHRADQALYQSKHQGRNRVTLAA